MLNLKSFSDAYRMIRIIYYSTINIMSALMKPPKKPGEGRGRGRGRSVLSPGMRGKGAPRGRGRGRGSASMGPRRQMHSEQINVGTMINYGDGASRQARFRWPITITEEQAICEVLKSLPEEDLPLISQVVFSQAPRSTQRIEWLDEEPKGNYYFNQDMYGEDGIQQPISSDLNYDPDIPGMQYVGDVTGYTVGGGGVGPGHQANYPVDPRMTQQGGQGRVGPGLRYDPNDLWGQYGPPPPQRFYS